MDTLKRDVGRPGSIGTVSTLKNAATEALAPEESGGSEPPRFEWQVRFQALFRITFASKEPYMG